MALHIGLSIGLHQIRACLIESSIKGWRFLEYREIELGEERDQDFVSALKQLFTEEERLVGNFYCLLPGDDVYYRILETPFSDALKTLKTVEVELDSSLPLALEELVVTFTPASSLNNTNRVFGYGIKKERVRQVLADLKEAGIDPYILDWDAVGLGIFSERIVPQEGKIILFLNIENDSFQMCFCSSEGIELARSVKAGSDKVADEIRRSAKFLLATSGRELNRILISGVVDVDSLSKSLEEELDISVDPLRLTSFYDELSQLPVSKESSAVIPISAAMRGIFRKHISGNFRTGEFSYKKSLAELRSSMVFAGGVAILLLLLTISDIVYKYLDRKRTYNELQAEITKVCSEFIKGYAPDMDCGKEMRKLFAGGSSRLYSNVKVIDMLRELSVRINRNLIVDVTEITAEGEKVKIKGKAASLETIDKIKTELSRSNYFASVDVLESRQDIDGSSFNFTISMILKGET